MHNHKPKTKRGKTTMTTEKEIVHGGCTSRPSAESAENVRRAILCVPGTPEEIAALRAARRVAIRARRKLQQGKTPADFFWRQLKPYCGSLFPKPASAGARTVKNEAAIGAISENPINRRTAKNPWAKDGNLTEKCLSNANSQNSRAISEASHRARPLAW